VPEEESKNDLLRESKITYNANGNNSLQLRCEIYTPSFSIALWLKPVFLIAKPDIGMNAVITRVLKQFRYFFALFY